ncbi:MAG: septation protein A [Rhodocyclaceae bacterium]|nr:septation protein A [Rhodocyclaceae bacterium]
MKLLFDLLPVILFFAAFKLYNVFVATAVVIAATFAQIAWVWYRHRKVDTMLWVSLALVVVFGGATLILHDELFIKWKPTVLYWIFAVVLFGSAVFFRKNLIRKMLDEQIQLPEVFWSRLNLAWVGFFTVMGALNLFVAFQNPFCTTSDECLAQWVNFKLFGSMGLMIAFIIGQGLFLAKYVPEETN